DHKSLRQSCSVSCQLMRPARLRAPPRLNRKIIRKRPYNGHHHRDCEIAIYNSGLRISARTLADKSKQVSKKLMGTARDNQFLLPLQGVALGNARGTPDLSERQPPRRMLPIDGRAANAIAF